MPRAARPEPAEGDVERESRHRSQFHMACPHTAVTDHRTPVPVAEPLTSNTIGEQGPGHSPGPRLVVR